MFRAFVIAVAMLSSSALSGRAAVPLQTALARAYLDNPRLEAARARLRGVDEGVAEARAASRPLLTAVSRTAQSQIETDESDLALSTFEGALNLEQNLYAGGRISAGIDIAELEVLAERARLETVEQDVLLDAVAVYTAVLRDEAVLALALANEDRLLEQFEAVRDRFRFGGVTRTDVAQAEVRYAAAIAERKRAEGNRSATLAAFHRVIGEMPGDLIWPGLPGRLPESREAALARIDETPLVRAARLALAAAERGVDFALADRRPRVVLNGEASYVDEPSSLIDWQQELTIGATVTIPLYQGGGEFARLRRSRQAVNEQRHRLEEARREVREEVVAALEALETARAAIQSLERRRHAAEIALDGVREEAVIGARTVLDVLDAEQELFEAEVALVDAQRDRLVAAYRLRAATGDLSAIGLGLDAALYDPQTYYEDLSGAWFGGGRSE